MNDNVVSLADELADKTKETKEMIRAQMEIIAKKSTTSIIGEIKPYDCGDNQINLFRMRLFNLMKAKNTEEHNLCLEAVDKLVVELETNIGFLKTLEARKEMHRQLKITFEDKLVNYFSIIEQFILKCLEDKSIDLNNLMQMFSTVKTRQLKLPEEVIALWTKYFKWCVVQIKANELEELLPPSSIVGAIGTVTTPDKGQQQ